MKFVKVNESLVINLNTVEYVTYDPDDGSALIVFNSGTKYFIASDDADELFKHIPRPNIQGKTEQKE